MISTFAWYKATSGATYAKVDDSATISTTTSTIDLGTVTFTTHIREVNSDSDSESFTGIELSDGSGNKGYYNSGVFTQAAGNASYRMFKVVVTTALSAGAEGTKTQALISIYNQESDHQLQLRLLPSGNTVVAYDGDESDGVLDAAAKSAANSATVRSEVRVQLGLASDGLTETWTKYFVLAVRPNNLAGPEWKGSDYDTEPKGQAADYTWTSLTVHNEGTSGKTAAVGTQVYLLNADVTENEDLSSSAKVTRIDHGADGIAANLPASLNEADHA